MVAEDLERGLQEIDEKEESVGRWSIDDFQQFHGLSNPFLFQTKTLPSNLSRGLAIPACFFTLVFQQFHGLSKPLLSF